MPPDTVNERALRAVAHAGSWVEQRARFSLSGIRYRRPLNRCAPPRLWCTLAPAGNYCQPLPRWSLVPMPDEILTLPEVAQLLKVAEKTVYTMAQKGELPAFKVRGQWRFKRDDINAWIEGQKAAVRAEPQPDPKEEK